MSRGFLPPAGRRSNSLGLISRLLCIIAFTWTIQAVTGPVILDSGVAYGQGDDSSLDAPDLTGAGGDPEAASGGPSGGNAERTLLDTIADGGIVGLLIFLLSVAAVAFIVEHSLTIRKSTLMPDHVMDELEELIHAGRIEDAVQACESPDNDSLVAQVVLSGLERYKGSEFGFAEYKAAVEEAGEDQTGRLYRKTEVLGLIGAVAPMLGLTGTVLGMIDAFNTIASTEGMAKPAQLAGGIGQALVTTLMGLVVAIPAMIAHNFFRNKIDSIISEAGKRVEQIMMPLGRRR